MNGGVKNPLQFSIPLGRVRRTLSNTAFTANFMCAITRHGAVLINMKIAGKPCHSWHTTLLMDGDRVIYAILGNSGSVAIAKLVNVSRVSDTGLVDVSIIAIAILLDITIIARPILLD